MWAKARAREATGELDEAPRGSVCVALAGLACILLTLPGLFRLPPPVPPASKCAHWLHGRVKAYTFV